MKKMMTVLAFAAFTMVTMPTAATAAGVEKGQKIYKKNFRKYCRFSGVKFSRKHTQDEWEELWDADKFSNEAKRLCPKLKLKKIKDSWWEDVYEFSYKYASDGVIPKC